MKKHFGKITVGNNPAVKYILGKVVLLKSPSGDYTLCQVRNLSPLTINFVDNTAIEVVIKHEPGDVLKELGYETDGNVLEIAPNQWKKALNALVKNKSMWAWVDDNHVAVDVAIDSEDLKPLSTFMKEEPKQSTTQRTHPKVAPGMEKPVEIIESFMVALAAMDGGRRRDDVDVRYTIGILEILRDMVAIGGGKTIDTMKEFAKRRPEFGDVLDRARNDHSGFRDFKEMIERSGIKFTQG